MEKQLNMDELFEALVSRGKQRGFLTVSEVQQDLEEADASADAFDDIVTRLAGSKVKVVEDSIDEAITVDYSRNVRTGKHTIQAPVVHSEACTGCGRCENACITRKASIFVLPREIAMGKPSERYIKGWDERDEERMKDVTEEVTTQTPRSGKSAIDYLNQEDF